MEHPSWITDAMRAINDLWVNEYKDRPMVPHSLSSSTTATTTVAPIVDHEDGWMDDDANNPGDQLLLHEVEPHPQISVKESPIPYWISKQAVWPQLVQMALDIYSTPACSDKPERVFSMAGNLLSPRRRQLKGESIEQMLCLRSWQASGLINLDTLCSRVVSSSADTSLPEDHEQPLVTTSNLRYHEQSYGTGSNSD
jgi:hypothetical protein